MLMEHENCPCMETCPLNRAMALIGGKWKMQILCSLYNKIGRASCRERV